MFLCGCRPWRHRRSERAAGARDQSNTNGSNHWSVLVRPWLDPGLPLRHVEFRLLIRDHAILIMQWSTIYYGSLIGDPTAPGDPHCNSYSHFLKKPSGFKKINPSSIVSWKPLRKGPITCSLAPGLAKNAPHSPSALKIHKTNPEIDS